MSRLRDGKVNFYCCVSTVIKMSQNTVDQNLLTEILTPSKLEAIYVLTYLKKLHFENLFKLIINPVRWSNSAGATKILKINEWIDIGGLQKKISKEIFPTYPSVLSCKDKSLSYVNLYHCRCNTITVFAIKFRNQLWGQITHSLTGKLSTVLESMRLKQNRCPFMESI